MQQGNKKRKVIAFSVFLLLFVGFVIYHAVGAARFLSGVSDAEASIYAAQESAELLRIAEAQADLQNAREGLERAHSGVRFFSWMGFVPWVGDQVKAVDAILAAGVESLTALDLAIDVAEELYAVFEEAEDEFAKIDPELELTFSTLPSDVKADLLRTFNRSAPQLQEAQVQLHLALDNLESLQELTVLPQIATAVEEFEVLLPEVVTVVDFLVPLAFSIDDIAGVDQDRQWLVLFMNDMEMRPGGGFLGVYGLTTVRDGDIVDLDVSDTYAVDVLVQFDDTYQVAPPDALREYVGVDKWYFRDANWSPDFAISSQDSITLLRQELAQAGRPVPEVHGVFGLTPTFGSWLLDITGPLMVGGEEFTSENLPSKLEFEVEVGYVEEGIAFEDRKEIVGDLVDLLVQELMMLPIEDYPTLFSTFSKGFTEKHIGLFSPEEKTQNLFIDAGWAGTIKPRGADDFLMVVDANMLALKTDAVMEREVQYSIRNEEGDYIATTAITYHHNGELDVFTSRYKTFTRVYAPLGSELVGVDGARSEPVVADELELTSFGAFFIVDEGTSATLTFEYRLPPAIAEAIEGGVYELRVFKQMGAKNHALTLHLDFDKKLKAALPSEDQSQFGDTAYTVNTNIDQNKEFIIGFQ